MDPQPPEPSQLSRWTQFWLIFLPLTLVCVWLLSPLRLHLQRRDADRTVELLRPLLAADARFLKVTVSRTTKDRARLAGEVASKEDLVALYYLVEQAHPPQKPGFAVRFPLPSKNDFRDFH
jgi:hypothetical protein